MLDYRRFLEPCCAGRDMSKFCQLASCTVGLLFKGRGLCDLALGLHS
jgi:hypothetical protein